METYGKILLIAMPVFLLLVLLEKLYGWYTKKDPFRNMDTISSLSSGVTNVTKDVLGLSIGIISYQWMVTHLAIFTIKETWITYVIAFIAIDFSGYWVHRWSHHINIFWNLHIIHHSSEEFNLACALRQSISSFFELFTFLLLPAALVGVPANVIAVVAPIQLFAQFWYHTRYINKMGVFEKIIVTPSHHRVHHAINKEYLDKNLGQIFIIWDRLFGTYQEELPNVPPVYGITRPASTWNPIKINFQHLWLLIKDAWRTESLRDKLRIWVMPTGWRPADVIENYPVKKIEDVYNFEKYDPKAGKALQGWSWVQLIMLLLFVSYLFGNIAAIGSPGMFVYGGYIFLTVYAFTELMDKSRYAFVWEAIKNILGFYILYRLNGWFGLNNFIPMSTQFLAVYFIISSCTAAWFVYENKKENKQTALPAL